MLWIGLTGGIACGKSTVSAALRKRGLCVIDADQLAREVVARGSAGLAEIAAAFGPESLDARGELDRKRLGALVFADAGARTRLNAIVHPRIASRAAAERDAAQARGEWVAFYDAALIVENGLQRDMHGLIVVESTRERQIERLVQRDGLDRRQAEARLAAQLDPAERRAAATWLIDNDGEWSAAERQLDAILDELSARWQAEAKH